MRKYEETHPWIKFTFNMAMALPNTWLYLGEAQSKIDHLSRAPLQPETAQKLMQLYLAKGAAATTAIEGNTLSEEQVLAAVKGTLEVPESKEYQKQEVDNVLGVFNEITAQIAADKLPALTPALIKEYNRKVLNALQLEEGVVPGEYREHSVLVGNIYRGAPAQDSDYLMDRLCTWLEGEDFKAPKGRETVYAIVKAVVAHLYLAWIHPFGDGNGRTARLIEVYILMGAGVPSPAAHLLSNHYNQTRTEYYRQLAHASKSGGDILPFMEYAVRGLVDGLREQLELTWEQHMEIVWQNFVHEVTRPGSSPMSKRQHDLVIELGLKKQWVEIATIPELSPALAAAYATKGPKTVKRDINALAKLGIIEKEYRRVRAKCELIFAFLPLRKMKRATPLATSGQLPLTLQ